MALNMASGMLIFRYSVNHNKNLWEEKWGNDAKL